MRDIEVELEYFAHQTPPVFSESVHKRVLNDINTLEVSDIPTPTYIYDGDNFIGNWPDVAPQVYMFIFLCETADPSEPVEERTLYEVTSYIGSPPTSSAHETIDTAIDELRLLVGSRPENESSCIHKDSMIMIAMVLASFVGFALAIIRTI